MTKASIIAAIEVTRGTIGYSAWRIGLTHDPGERKKYWSETEKQNVALWSQWQANSLSDAQDIEAQFINKGMKGGTGGDLSSYKTVHVYVF
jgi:hypothetical protein